MTGARHIMKFYKWMGWRGSWSDLFASWLQLNIGLILAALGLTLMVKANFGMGPWGVFQVALCLQTGMSFGVSIQLVGVVLLAFSYLIARLVPPAGTIANMYIVGIYVDYFFFPRIHDFEGMLAQFLACIGSIIIFSIGGAVYLSANQGPGPRDGLMMAIYMRTKFSLRKVRTILEVFVLAVGWLMGGPVGIGTILFAFLVGPILQFSLAILPRLPVRIDRISVLSEYDRIVTNAEKIKIEET